MLSNHAETQMEPQSAEQFPWRYKPGESGNPLGPTAARKLRVDAKCRELAAEYGGWDGLSVVERTLIEQAAALLVRRKPLSAEDAVRCANAVGRLLHAVDCRRGKHRRGPAVWRGARWYVCGGALSVGLTSRPYRGRTGFEGEG